MNLDRVKSGLIEHGSWLAHNIIVHPIVGIAGSFAHFAGWLHEGTLQWDRPNRYSSPLCVDGESDEHGKIWAVVEAETGVHVIPIEDAVDHSLDGECTCGPAVDCSEDRPLYTHHSLDGREQYEKKEA